MRSLIWITVAACSSSSFPEARFTNATPVRVVNDRQNVATPPSHREFRFLYYHFEGSVRRPLVAPFEVERKKRSLGVNALDEVPDSTWFTNRLGVRELTPDEIRRGPTTIDNPAKHVPWTVLGKKSTGISLGYLVKDARGEQFLVKFDAKTLPETETASHVITGRLLWAAGYNVTEDFIANVRREDLRVAPNASWKDDAGIRRKLTERVLDEELAKMYHRRDGRLRAMASRWLSGRALGGHPGSGVRHDDPNDKIPHERRRDLRGARPIFAWLDNVDVKESNTIDVWVQDPADPSRHFVRHYFIDFGKSLGTMARQAHDDTRAYEYAFDMPEMYGSLISLGTKPNEWSDRRAPSYVGLGLFEKNIDPRRWKPYTPAYQPFLETDRFDYFWGAKLIQRFTPEQLRAAVDVGELSDPRTADYLVEALLARRQVIGAYAFSRVQPIDNVSAAPGAAFCFDDLGVVYRLGSVPERYVVTAYDRAGRQIGAAQTVDSTPSGHACTGQLPLAGGADRYTIWRLRTPGSAGHTYVHVARDPARDSMRVIGLWRE